MALECAHCGTRVADGAVRCPQCLRGTGLVEIAAAPVRKPGSNAKLAMGGLVALVVLGAVGSLVALRFPRGSPTPDTSALARSLHLGAEVPDAFATGSASAPWVSQVRGSNGDLVRARRALDLVTAALSHAHLVDDAHDAPASRSIDDIVGALASADGRVTSLDLARVIAAVLRETGTHAVVGEQIAAVRAGEAVDPSGVLGRYAAMVGDTAIDVYGRTLLGARDLHVRALDDRSVTGAMLAQSALNAGYTGAPHDRLLALADGAVAAWRDGVVPLAVRAEAWRIAGASGGLALADQDLASALALRDEAPLHVMRARFALMGGRGDVAATEIRAALTRSRSYGLAALAGAIANTEAVDGGDRCSALHDSGDSWAPLAWVICRGGVPNAPSVSDAARQLAAAGTDPMTLAYAAAAGADGVFARVHSYDRDELAVWLQALGRPDLADIAAGRVDAGR